MDSILDSQENIALTKWYIQEKQLDKALLQIKPVIQSEAAEAEALLIAARLYAQLQLFSHAQKLFKRYMENNEQDTAAQFQLGMCYFDSGEQQKALEEWANILKQNEKHPPALFYTAIAQLQQNKTDNALQHLKRILNTAQVDNLYYNKAKELVVQIENQSPNIDNLPTQELYQTEH